MIYNPIYRESSEKEHLKLIRQLVELKKAEFFLNDLDKIENAKRIVLDRIKIQSWSKIK